MGDTVLSRTYVYKILQGITQYTHIVEVRPMPFFSDNVKGKNRV